MEIIYILLPASLVLALLGLAGYLWAVRSGQFDDLDTPPIRVLLEEEDESDSRDKQVTE